MLCHKIEYLQNLGRDARWRRAAGSWLDLPGGGGYWRESLTAPGAHDHSPSHDSCPVKYRPSTGCWFSGEPGRQNLESFLFLSVLATNLTCVLNCTPVNWVRFRDGNHCYHHCSGQSQHKYGRRTREGAGDPKGINKAWISPWKGRGLK